MVLLVGLPLPDLVMLSPSDPVAFSIFGLDVRWYALFMLAGVVAGLLLARFIACRIDLIPTGSSTLLPGS